MNVDASRYAKNFNALILQHSRELHITLTSLALPWEATTVASRCVSRKTDPALRPKSAIDCHLLFQYIFQIWVTVAVSKWPSSNGEENSYLRCSPTILASFPGSPYRNNFNVRVPERGSLGTRLPLYMSCTDCNLFRSAFSFHVQWNVKERRREERWMKKRGVRRRKNVR